MSVAVYITVMSLTTYLIRMVPFTFFRRKIKSRFLNDFLSCIPYAVLTAISKTVQNVNTLAKMRKQNMKNQ